MEEGFWCGRSFLWADDAVGARKCDPSTGFFERTEVARPSGFDGTTAGGGTSFLAEDAAVGAVR